MIFRILSSLVLTIILSGSWCIVQTSGNMFWLPLTIGTYFTHIAIWCSISIIILTTLIIASRYSEKTENSVYLFLFILCPIHCVDYSLRSIFGEVGKWPKYIVFIWLIITMSLPFVAVYFTRKISLSKKIIRQIINLCIVPSLLFVYYGYPSKFVTLNIEQPKMDGNQTPIHIMVFDMLSFDFIMDGNNVRKKYDNLSSFSKMSTIYYNAHSPSPTTSTSIPGLIIGKSNIKLVIEGAKMYVKYKNDAQVLPLETVETIFTIANKKNYNVFLQGFCLPYINNFPNQIQKGNVFPFNTLWRLGMHSVIWPIVAPGGVQHQKTARKIFENYCSRIKKNALNTLFFIHWNIPHDPFIYDKDGNELSRFQLVKNLIKTPYRKEMYKNQLIATDKMFGHVIKAMKESNTFDQSLIIVTSDHNIAGYELDMTHVPLFIKLPYQSTQNIIIDKVENSQLFEYIKSFLEKKTSSCYPAYHQSCYLNSVFFLNSYNTIRRFDCLNIVIPAKGADPF